MLLAALRGQRRQQGLYKLLLRSFETMGDSLRRNEVTLADIVIRPDVSRIASTDFSARRALLEAGFIAGQRLAPVILEKLKAKRWAAPRAAPAASARRIWPAPPLMAGYQT